MIALRSLVFGRRKLETTMRIHVIAPPARSVDEPERKPAAPRPQPGTASLDRFSRTRYDTLNQWYRLGGRWAPREE